MSSFVSLKLRRELLTLILGAAGFFNCGFAAPSAQGGWITDWLVAGPVKLAPPKHERQMKEHLPGFENDYLEQIGGEAKAGIMVNGSFKTGNDTLTWIRCQAKDSVVNIEQLFPGRLYCLAYAYTEIEMTQPGYFLLAFGSDDGARVWLNGEMVWDVAGMRGIGTDEDIIPVSLNQGKNTILVKIENYTHRWGLRARLLPLDAAKLTSRGDIFTMANMADGSVFFKINYPRAVIDRLFMKGRLEIVRGHDTAAIVRESEWMPAVSTPLMIDPGEYDYYMLRCSFTLKGHGTVNLRMPFKGGKKIDYCLFSGGKSKYSIVVCNDASESEKWAARELQRWLKEAGGAELPIVVERATCENQVILGYRLCSELLADSSLHRPADDDESFVYRNKGSNILIWGGSDRGTMYGVFSFLERELGCRWYTPAVTVIPKRKAFYFNNLRFSDMPGVKVRNDFYFEAFDPEWAARNRLNGFFRVPPIPGGGYGYWGVHTFYRFLPPDEFFSVHPEYYSLVDGKRTARDAQLCLTNPEVLRIVVDRLKKVMRMDPGYSIYCVSQNDCYNPCQCDRCQKIAREEGSEAGPVLWFVNQVAEQVEEEFPGKYVGTLAYQYSRKPCRNIVPRHNVVIRLCSIECCFSHPMEGCPRNKPFIDDLRGWAAIAPHLYIWDYVVNFRHYLMPYPNFSVLQPNVQTFARDKAIGIMEQACYQTRGSEFAELRAYLIAKLLWDPYRDVDEVVNDFMYGYYGRAGQYVRQYYDLLDNLVKEDTHIGLLMETDEPVYTKDFINRGGEIFDKAETIADSEIYRRRVELARLPVMYLKYRHHPDLCRYDGTLRRIREIIKREGITHYSELAMVNDGTFSDQ